MNCALCVCVGHEPNDDIYQCLESDLQGARRHHRGYREIYVHYNSKVLSERGGAGQRVGYTKTSPRASPNRITQNHKRVAGLEEI